MLHMLGDFCIWWKWHNCHVQVFKVVFPDLATPCKTKLSHLVYYRLWAYDESGPTVCGYVSKTNFILQCLHILGDFSSCMFRCSRLSFVTLQHQVRPNCRIWHIIGFLRTMVPKGCRYAIKTNFCRIKLTFVFGENGISSCMFRCLMLSFLNLDWSEMSWIWLKDKVIIFILQFLHV